MRDRRFSSVRLSWNVSPMNLDCIFEGSTGFNKPFLGFDLETFSPDGFPSCFRDPIVNFSVAVQGEAGFLIISFVSRPSFELELIKILRGVLEALGGGVLFTYNGLKFNVEYAFGRAALYGLDLRGVFGMYRHLDLYRLLRHSRVKLESYGQKSVERTLGINRVVTDVYDANYHRYYLDFWREGNLKPIFYNMEDSVGCLKLAGALQKFIGFKIKYDWRNSSASRS